MVGTDIHCNTFHKNKHKMKNPDVLSHAIDIFTMHRKGRDFEMGEVFWQNERKMGTVTAVSLLEH